VARSLDVVPFVLASVATASCGNPETGVGQGPSGGGSMGAPLSTGSPSDSAGEGSGLDDTSGADPPPPPAAKSYFIAESMDFTGNGCEGIDLNDVTSSLRNKLDNDGWTGIRVTEGQTKPSDFIDPRKQAYGHDHMNGDAASLAVYAGHGDMNRLQWGTRDDDTPGLTPLQRCNAFFSKDIRLGSMSGGWAKAVALLTSCTGRLACYESSLGTSDATQVFAFNNSPIIWNNAARRFYRKSGRMPNRDAWIKAMDNRPGIGKNSPVVYTRGTSRDEALQIHGSARLSEIDETPSAQGTTWYAYTWVDHGLKGSCTSLSDTCVGIDE
jgi:hypothetical protein